MGQYFFEISMMIISGAAALFLLLIITLIKQAKKGFEDKIDQLMSLYTMTLGELKEIVEDVRAIEPIVERNKEDIKVLFKSKQSKK